MPKKTTSEMVDEMMRVGPTDWIPPLPRYVDPDDGKPDVDWSGEWRKLATHHERETTILFAVIGEMYRRLRVLGREE